MLIFLSGENSYERSRYASALLEEYLKKHGHLGVRNFDFFEDSLPEFIEFTRSRSIFNPVKLAFLNNLSFQSLKNNQEDGIFAKTLEAVKDNEEIVVLISSDNIPDSLSKLAAESPINKSFQNPEGGDLHSFLKKEGKKRGLSLSDADCANIVAGFGSDLRTLINELERLSLSGERTNKDNYSGMDLFSLVNNFRFGKNKAQKLLALEIIFSKIGADGAYVFNLLTSFAPKTMRQEEWFSLLSDYDVSVKSGVLGYEEALLDLALK